MNTANSQPINWTLHRHHELVVSEAHARPSQPISGVSQIIHLAFRCDKETTLKFFSVLGKVDAKEPPRHFTVKMEEVTIKIERHTEFISCTLFRNGSGEKKEALRDIAARLLPLESVELMVLLRVDMVAILKRT